MNYPDICDRSSRATLYAGRSADGILREDHETEE